MKTTLSEFRAVVGARRLPAAACILAALVLWAGCAYFNTLYNAKRIYREAEEIPRGKDGALSPQAADKYKEVIEKCESLIANYPRSKYVDDAVLLIGRSLYENGEYSDAIARLDALETTSNDEKLKTEGRLYQAKAHIGKGDLENAVPIVQALVDKNPDKVSDETFFLLGTSLVKIGNETDAVKYLEMLARRYPDSPYRVRADLEAAELYAERKDYEKSAAVYARLDIGRVGERNLVRYLRGRSRLYVEMGEFEESIAALEILEQIVIDPGEKAGDLLVMARAQAGRDSLAVAIDTYKTVAVSYPRSMFSAEGYFRLGEIYQDKLDSLEVAKQNFDQVPQQYAGSPFAEDAIARGAAISKLLRLKESLESGGEGEQPAAQFDLAEIELFQLKNYAKAIEEYRKYLERYPDGDLAPKAAYAVAYVYHVRLGDAEKAREAYQYVLDRYPDTPQAAYAGEALERMTAERQP